MSPASVIVALICGAFVVYGIKASIDTYRLTKSGKLQREYDMLAVARYFRDIERECASLPDRTWADLDLDLVFQRIDRTASWPGQHLLYARLRREDHSDDHLLRFDAGVSRLVSDAALRDRIRATLTKLNHWSASRLPALFGGALPALPFAARFTPLLTVASVAMLAATLWHPSMILGVLACTVANIVVRLVLQTRIEPFLPALRSLEPMLRAARTLSRIDAAELAAQTTALRVEMKRLEWIGRAGRWSTYEPRGDIDAMIYTYINLLLLADVSAFAWSAEAIRARRAAIREMYEAIGELDVMLSVATLRNEPRTWCRPEFMASRERAFAVSTITHPVLDDPVPNSLTLDGRNIVLTGSNMSGKSTFVRTVGVNAVLARTIYTVFAKSWCAPKLAVRTSIGRADSLLEGKSYYRAEVDAVGALFTSPSDDQRLILIDELFRGTNSIERIAAAHAVLAELDRGDSIVIVATHDVELLELLPDFGSYHFREEVRDGALTFDYHLHPGACSTRNALAILELAGYPESVVAEARVTAAALEQRVRSGTLST
ncbi:MAG: hypothetical protein ABI625_06110 [bacterium]